MAYVYILESLRDGRYYIGSTTDIEQRLAHHQKGLTPSTKRFGGLKLVLHQKYDSLSEARKVEKKLKNYKRKDFIAKIIRDGVIKIRI